MVDAYAGALGKLGYLPARDLETYAALIAGTSSCVMFARRADPFRRGLGSVSTLPRSAGG
ncbi:MAG: hypothetical protein R3E51_16225 [Rhizobiaceae bacterium]